MACGRRPVGAPAVMMSTVTLEHLGKTYDAGPPAVVDLDLEVADGEFFVLLGPSGCGKSTVLRMIAGVEHVTSGTVRIDGVRVNDVATRDRDVAMVFQSPALYPHMTVEQNLAFPLVVATVPHREISARVREVAGHLGLDELLGSRPAQLSGGQRQRVALGRAVIRSPRLLLMDEPLSNVDAGLRSELRAHLVFLQRRLGTTTIFVTHDQVEAMTMADRVAVLRGGRLAQCDRPLDLYDGPCDLFVAGFVGSPEMSFVSVGVVDGEGRPALRVGADLLDVEGAAARRFPTLGSMVGRDVVLGVRPEDVRLDGEGQLVGSAVHVEVLGHEQLVHVALEAARVVPHAGGVELDREPGGLAMLLPADRPVDIWQPMRLRVDTARVHLFDPATGDSLASRSG